MVFVTGGATGIGYATARAFALAGASTVVLVARRAEVLKQKAAELSAEVPSAAILTYSLDITDEARVNNVFADVRQRLSTGKDIDVLVLSAASISAGKRALDYTPEELRNDFETNVVGNRNVVRAFLAPVPVEDGEARTSKVVLDVSTHSTYERYPTQALYSASKAAFTQYMRHVHAEYAHTGLRVHAYHPGGIYTEAAQAAGYGKDAVAWDDASLPAGLAVWLASPAAEFLNGRFLLAYWDVDELMAMKDQFEKDEDLGKIVLKIKPDA